MKNLITLVILFFSCVSVFGTHQRAAEITYKHLGGLTYEFKIVSYTYTPSPADRPSLELYWGDSTYSVVQRTLKINLANNISRNEYVTTHTYSGPGTYIIWLEDPNRNYGVINIPGSVNIPMYVNTMLVIHPYLGANSSPELLNPPIDVGCVYNPFYHNPGAYDADGDSLSYKLVICKGAGGLDISGYTYPQTSNIFELDPITGTLTWDSPQLQGEYNIAMHIEEYRNGIKIGYVTRDMQINIIACNNHPPEIAPIPDTCIEAGDTLSFIVSATDPDLDVITLTATGGPLIITGSPAQFPQPVTGTGSVSSVFTWITNCQHVQKYPYQVYFRVVDNGFPVNLLDIETMQIKVVGPAPRNLTATPVTNNIELTWEKSKCTNATGYKIYRRNGYYGYFPGHCETGIPAKTGYVKIAEISDINDTSYIDDNNGQGLIHGIEYCYMVFAYYPDGAESYASLEACATLIKDVPVITNVSIDVTDENNGSVYIAWSKPTEFDTILIPGPYKYLVYRSFDFTGNNLVLVDSLDDINDTTFSDLNVNTKSTPVSYRIDFYNDQPGNEFYVGSTQIASSVFLMIAPTDNSLKLSWNENVPWLNDQYVIYRYNPVTLLYDSVGITGLQSFTDTGLVNGEEYFYYVKSIGDYTATGFISPIINLSQVSSGIPVDNVAPCPPELWVSTDCESNYLNWTNPNHSCADDVMKYEILYSPFQYGDMVLIATIESADDTAFIHSSMPSIAGCYAVIAIDSTGNRSLMSNFACVDIDSCSLYRLPNIFTPNNDNFNDYFKPFPYHSVDRINIRIFNRWGTVVYETSDPDIMWDGRDHSTKKDCSDGVYYFVCEVYEIRLKGISKRTISGSVTLMRGEK